MTTQTLTDALLDEAEAIVRAELMRLYHTALREGQFTGSGPRSPPLGHGPRS